MSLIRLRQVSKRYGRKQVLSDVFYRLAPGDRTGLLGRNGSGKTTVLRLILGREEPSEGEIEVAADLRIGYFSQFSELSGEASIESVLREVFESIRRIEANLADVARALAEGGAGDRQDRLLKRYEALTDEMEIEMEHRDGWTYEHRIDNALSRLGFSRRHRTMPIDHLSGGWRNRGTCSTGGRRGETWLTQFRGAALWSRRPALPGPRREPGGRDLPRAPAVLRRAGTNHLDVTATQVMERALVHFPGAVIVVSHDRFFIDKVATRLLVFEGGGRASTVNANWTLWQAGRGAGATT